MSTESGERAQVVPVEEMRNMEIMSIYEFFHDITWCIKQTARRPGDGKYSKSYKYVFYFENSDIFNEGALCGSLRRFFPR